MEREGHFSQPLARPALKRQAEQLANGATRGSASGGASMLLKSEISLEPY